MLLDLGVACAWMAMSAAGAAVLVLLGRFGNARFTVYSQESFDTAHEDLYPAEPLSAVAELWR